MSLRNAFHRHTPQLLLALILATTAATATGCRAPADVVEGHQARDGMTTQYKVSPAQARQIAMRVLYDNGFEVIEQHHEHHVLGMTAHHFWTGTTYAGVWFEPGADGGTQVTVVTKRRLSVQLMTNLTDTGFHDDFAAYVASWQQTGMLPSVRTPGAG